MRVSPLSPLSSVLHYITFRSAPLILKKTVKMNQDLLHAQRENKSRLANLTKNEINQDLLKAHIEISQ